MSDTPIRVGVIGLGLIAQSVHLPNLHTLRDRFTVVHVCDVSATVASAVAAELPGEVRTSTDWRDVVADPGVDAVVVLTPGSHGEIVAEALSAGKHVLAEKPLASSAAELDELQTAASAAGTVLQVAYMKMYDPAVARARQELDALGELRVVRVTVLHPTDECQFEHVNVHRGADADGALIDRSVAYATERTREAIGDPASPAADLYEGVLLGSVVHELSLLRALGLGLPQHFDFVSVDPPLTAPASEPPRLLAVGTLPGGAQLHLSWNWVPDFPEYTEEIAVFGKGGRLHLLMPGPYLPAHRAHLRVQRVDDGLRSDATFTAGHDTAFVEELRAFADSVQHGAPVLSTLDGARADTECLQHLVGEAARSQGISVGGEVGAWQGA